MTLTPEILKAMQMDTTTAGRIITLRKFLLGWNYHDAAKNETNYMINSIDSLSGDENSKSLLIRGQNAMSARYMILNNMIIHLKKHDFKKMKMRGPTGNSQ